MDYTPSALEGVIPKPRVLSSGARDLLASDMFARLILQTKHALPDRMSIHLPVTMRIFMPNLCSILRSWTVLPSGL